MGTYSGFLIIKVVFSLEDFFTQLLQQGKIAGRTGDREPVFMCFRNTSSRLIFGIISSGFPDECGALSFISSVHQILDH